MAGQTKSRVAAIVAGVFLVAGTWAAITYATADRQTEPHKLLGRDSVVYFTFDGTKAHGETYRETAAYEAMYESGLMDFVGKLLKFGAGRMMPPADLAAVTESLEGMLNDGFSFSVAFGDAAGPPVPTGTLVLHNASGRGPALAALLRRIAEKEGTPVESRTVSGRTVTSLRPDRSGMEISWWSEGGHLVLTAGIQAPEQAIAVADGEQKSLADNPNFHKARRSDKFEVASIGWIDLGLLRNKFGGMPLPNSPNPMTVNQILAALGLDKTGVIAGRTGYKGKATWSEAFVEAPAPRTGLMALGDQPTITLDDLPPLPEGTTGFFACSFDPTAAWDTGMATARSMLALGPPQAAQSFEQGLAQLPQMIGLDPKTELIDALGNVYCAYSDPAQAIFGINFGLAASVKDAPQLRRTIDRILQIAEQQAGSDDFSVRRYERDGRQYITLNFGATVPVTPTMVVDDKWLVMGLQPQSVQSMIKRIDGKLAKWEPTEEHTAALAELPKEFTSISVGDPRPQIQSLLGLAPMGFALAENALRESGVLRQGEEMPVTPLDLPDPGSVAAPLFPNVTIGTADDAGFHSLARQSLPTIPIAGMQSGATVPILVALLLPAVQSAREAARRTQSKNNLKQIILALHNYYDVHNQFPTGTVPNEKLKPDDRLSWLTPILPYCEQQALSDLIDQDAGWNDPANKRALSTRLPIFLNPSQPVQPSELGATHYVGIAGHGPDAANLRKDHPRAGVFGYNRVVRFRDILDGTSNTLGIMDASAPHGPWGAGGSATIRAFTQKPYLNGPDGIGSPHPGVVQGAMMDGSVHAISTDIDPTVLEALSTIVGGETINGF